MEEQTILNILKLSGFPVTLSQIILAQAKHETGNFTSPVYQDCNNAFGYSAYQGHGACQGHSFYRHYPSLIESTHELVGWIERRQWEGNFPLDLNEIKTAAQYAELLKENGYYEDSLANYKNGLERWLDYLPGATTGIGVMLLVLVGIIAIGNNSYKNKH